MEMIREMWVFLRTRKKFWLWPVVGMMIFLGALIVLAEGSAVAPLVYTIF